MSQDRIASLYSPSELRGLDVHIRVEALTQIAGKRVRWTPDARGLTDATKHFLAQGVRLHPSWVDPHANDIAGTMQSQALKKLRDEAKAAQLIADIIMGETLKSHPRGEIGSAADDSKDKILGGGSTGKFKAYLLRHLGQKAVDMLRSQQRRVRREDTLPGPGAVDDEGVSRELPAEVLLDADPDVLASDPMVRRWIEDQIEDLPGPDYHKDIALAWLDDPGRRGLQADLARQYDISAPTVINIIKKMTKFLKDRLMSDERQRRHWQSLLLRSDIADIQSEFLGRYASIEDAPRMARVAHFLRHLYRLASEEEPSVERVASAWKVAIGYAEIKKRIREADKLVQQGKLEDADALIKSMAGHMSKHDLHSNMPRESLMKLRDWARSKRSSEHVARSPFQEADALYLEGELGDRGFGFKKKLESGGERGDGTVVEVPVYRVYNPQTRANVFEIRLLRDDRSKQLDLYPMKGQRRSPRAVTFRGPMDPKFTQLLDQMVEYHGMI